MIIITSSVSSFVKPKCRVFRYFCLGQSQNFQKAVTLLIIIKVMSITITITRIRIQDDHLSWVVQTHYSDRAGKPTQLNTTVPDLTLYTILYTQCSQSKHTFTIYTLYTGPDQSADSLASISHRFFVLLPSSPPPHHRHHNHHQW